MSLTGKIGLVVTVRNDAEDLLLLLEAISQQSLLPDEIVITVAASVDASLAVARHFHHPKINVTVQDIGWQNRSQGRNIGVSLLSDECAYIVFTDAGCLPDKDWIKEITKPLANGNDVVSGFTWGRSNNAFELAQLPFVLVPMELIDKSPLPATRNMAIRRLVFDQRGRFDSRLQFAEDYELAGRLRNYGADMVFAPLAKVYWRPRPSSLSYLTMIMQLTAGDVYAQTWRAGLITMWLRYLLLLCILIALSTLLTPLLAFLISLMLWIIYIGVKSWRLTAYISENAWQYLPQLQILTDFGVLFGSISAIWNQGRHRAQRWW